MNGNKRLHGNWRRSGQRGAGIMELAIVGAVALILMTIAVPGIKSTIDSYNLQSAADAIAMQLSLARSRAVLKNQTMTFTFTSTDFGLSPNDPAAPRQPLPTGFTYSPAVSSIGTLTIAGNGTIQPTKTLTLTNAQGQSITLTITAAGYVKVSSVS